MTSRIALDALSSSRVQIALRQGALYTSADKEFSTTGSSPTRHTTTSAKRTSFSAPLSSATSSFEHNKDPPPSKSSFYRPRSLSSRHRHPSSLDVDATSTTSPSPSTEHHHTNFLDRAATAFHRHLTSFAATTGRTCSIAAANGKRADKKQALSKVVLAEQFAERFADTTFTANAGTPQEHIQHIHSEAAKIAAAHLAAAKSILERA